MVHGLSESDSSRHWQRETRNHRRPSANACGGQGPAWRGTAPGTARAEIFGGVAVASRIQPTPRIILASLLPPSSAMDASSNELRTSILDWDENDVHNWLSKLGFPQYEQQVKGVFFYSSRRYDQSPMAF